MITIRHSWCPFQCFKYLTAHSPSHQPTMMISRQIRQIWVPTRDGPLYRHIYIIYICTHLILFFFHFLGLRTPAIYPTGWPYHCTEERARRCYTKAGFKPESSSNASWGKKERSGSTWQRWKKVPTWSMWVPKRQVDQHWKQRGQKGFGFSLTSP